MEITEKNVIGELVAQDYRTAEVFAKYGIDFCCKGNQTIHDVCEKKNINENALIKDLLDIEKSLENSVIDYQAWPIDLLADYIEKKHHRYVQEKTPVLQQYLSKINSVHGKMFPELKEIMDSFNESAQMLAAHMKKEELILFPYIRKMAVATADDSFAPHFGTVQNPIAMMKEEHDTEGERFRKISELTNNYTPPEEACNTFRVTYALLKEFENDLHLHIHLENNILFPQAIAMEEERSPSSCEIN
ncbi:iron-sulfur cluster repair di-iron protein [Aurantibacillus circumpalustris]|uniref:iron-sulfur cluster repair di-iron protein n=1 Tax=Aurantibacillus circumpalustris TaxID=3036359 RepID=UPI00295A720E|nr:iron-sulfur cluster repair di-iron protein [Aurantibacillus circumpalustris]